MAERMVSLAQGASGEADIPEITNISVLATKNDDDSNSDPFEKSGDELRALNGMSTTMKRKVSYQINKVRRGVGGAESKQLENDSFVSGYDTFEVEYPPHNLEQLAKLYEISSHHYAAVNAKVSNIVGLGYKLVENAKSKMQFETIADDKDKTKKVRKKLDIHKQQVLDKIESFNKEDTFTEVLVKVWRDYEVTGNGYIEIGRQRDGSIGYIGHIPSQTMRIRKARDGFVQISGFDVQFFANFGAGTDEEGQPKPIDNPINSEVPNEVIHIKKYSPTSTYYGIPDIVAAQQAIAGNEFASRYNLDYFENKAVPRYIIILKNATLGASAEAKLLSFFETKLRGQNHRSLFIPLPRGDKENPVSLDFEKVEAGVQDSSFNNYRKANLADILMAHRVPITKVSMAEGVSLAVARDADKTFKEQVCAPEQRVFEKKLGRIIKELTDAFDLKLNEMTLTDEDTQSKIDERRRKTGVETANEQRLRRGEPAIEGGDTLFDLNAKAGEARTEATTSRERDSQRSAGATDSAGESRNPKGDGRSSP